MRAVVRRARRARRDAARTARCLERIAIAPLHVLAYHRVAEARVDPWGLAVAPQQFDDQLAQFRRHGDIVDLTDELDHRRLRRPARRPRFAVTFDDGYVDNLRVALPFLERHDVPATVFVPTGSIGQPSFWWDRLAALVFGSDVELDRLADAVTTGVGAGVGPPDADGDTAGHRAGFHERLHDRISRLEPGTADEVIDRIAAGAGIAAPAADGRPMTEIELVELAAHPLITIGAHGVHHRMLPRLHATDARGELRLGVEQLGALLGFTARVLAYPHGATDRATAKLAAEVGFAHALTTADRPVSVFDRRLRLPRRLPPDPSSEQFQRWLVSA